MHVTHTQSAMPVALSGGRIALFAIAAGLAVASLYYNHPILAVIGADLGAHGAALGWIPTLTQLGYAAGMLFLAPLGDRYDRRRIVLAKTAALFVALLGCALAPSLPMLLAASLATGIAATLAQDIVPAAAVLAPDSRRGRVVGTVMTGLLLGILLSRVVSGLVAQQFGWRAMFLAAAVGVGLLGIALHRGLPSIAPSSRLPYGALLGSLVGLWRQHPGLRRAALAQGLLSIGFSAFWTTLALMLDAPPFHLGAAVAGAFGLAGAAGALAAPIAGRLADRWGPAAVTRAGAGLTALSFAAMLAIPWLPRDAALWLLVIATVGFDLGIQATLIAHQTIIYGLDPAARSRLNTVLMVTMFIGMALGGALGAQMLAVASGQGVALLATATAAGAFVLRLRARA